MTVAKRPGPTMRDACPLTSEAFVCACCGREVLTSMAGLFYNPKVGSPRRFCDPACRQAAYRRRQAGVPEGVPLQRRGGRGRSLRAETPAPKERTASPTTRAP